MNLLALLLLACVLPSFVRVLRGPTRADQLMSAQLFGTSGAALMALLSAAMGLPALLDVALLLLVLGAVVMISFTLRHWRHASEEDTHAGRR